MTMTMHERLTENELFNTEWQKVYNEINANLVKCHQMIAEMTLQNADMPDFKEQFNELIKAVDVFTDQLEEELVVIVSDSSWD